MQVLMSVIFVFEESLQLHGVHRHQHLELAVDGLLPHLVELGLVEVQRAELIWCLEHVRYRIVEDLRPEDNAKVLLHQRVLHVETVPPLLLPIVLQCKVLNIEKLRLTPILVYSFHMLTSIGPLRS